MEFTASELWSRILESVRPGMPEGSFNTWLLPTRAVALTETELQVEAPSAFHVEWIEDKFRPVLAEVAQRLLGRPLALAFHFDPASASAHPPAEMLVSGTGSGAGESRDADRHGLTSAGAGPSRAAARSDRSEPRFTPRPVLNERYTFERFVVGSNNQLAAAACNAVAEKPARMYNPLFLYGGVGLGKTHLMHAIGNHILAQDLDRRVMYVSSEQFMNEMVNSIKTGTQPDFRRRYRQMDLLLVDDVHFLEKKEGTQEEFFHTFNALYDAKKQIILTSDRPPKQMPGLEDRLVSRFEWGLVADIKPPDFETRVAILRKKADDDGLTLDDEVMDFIAQFCTASVRELEGAVIKLLAYSSLTNQEITLSLARKALTGMIPDHARPVPGGPPRLTPETIRDVVARRWSVKPEALESKRRTKDLTVPRQVAMYLIRELLELPLVQIGEVFGGRDHSTVIHSLRRVDKKMNDDAGFRDQIAEARDELAADPRGPHN